ncbi:Fic family protein [Sphingomonas oligophenolica]|uniref:protein adenylyltransferase n=1 Tax=Sphingomonas oligophenolica TaxID=301154 RepID=A0ABU9XXR7_9SPHN
MNLSGYDAFDDPYAYKGTHVLKNKLGLRDTAALESFELEMSNSRATEALPDGDYDPRHYREVHRHLFQDVYRWAGKYRTVRTSKDSNPFCFPEHIPNEMNLLFEALRTDCLPSEDASSFLASAAAFLAELNAIHPFREGNGRAQLAFMHLVGLRAGFPFDFSRAKSDTFLAAMIASYHGDLTPLVTELRALLT